MPTLQETMLDKLNTIGIPSVDINVYGGQVTVTCECEASARRWKAVLATFCRRVRCIETIIYNKKNINTVMLPSCRPAYRVYGTI